MSSARPRSASAPDASDSASGGPAPARFWRVAAIDVGPTGTMWDVQRLHFEFDGDVSSVDHVASGSFDDRFGPANAFAADDTIWGGRADANGLHIGVELSAEAVPVLVAMANGSSGHRASSVRLERSEDGIDWQPVCSVDTRTDRRRHTLWYAPPEPRSSRAWRVRVDDDIDRFAWDVSRLKLLHRGQEHHLAITSSGDAGPDWSAGNVLEDGFATWGGRPGADGAFHVELRADAPIAVDRIVLDQAGRHHARAVLLECLDDAGDWTIVRRFDRLQPGRNELFLHSEPPELLPGHAREGEPITPIRPTPAALFDPFADRRILVLIAAYRDKELPRTVAHALAQAAYPEHVRFAICHQFDQDTHDLLERWSDDPRFSVDSVPYEQSRGCCWARDRTFALYDDEPYVLQIDAHTRFAARWDVRFIEMLESIDVDRPVLTTYPPSFRYVDGELVYDLEVGVQRLRIEEVRADLTTLQKTEPMSDRTRPGWSPSIAAGQIFTRGEFVRDVPYDPNVYFAGEEISLAARAYTSGYDLFCPHENLIWHLYDHEEPKHWEDHADHTTSHEQAMARLRTLFTGDAASLGRHGLGRERTIEEFERHAGIALGTRVEPSADRPALRRPPVGDSADHESGFVVHIDRGAIEQRDDYEAFVVVLLDAAGSEIWRTALRSPDVLELRTERVVLHDVDATGAASYVVIPVGRNGRNGRVGTIAHRSIRPGDANAR